MNINLKEKNIQYSLLLSCQEYFQRVEIGSQQDHCQRHLWHSILLSMKIWRLRVEMITGLLRSKVNRALDCSLVKMGQPWDEQEKPSMCNDVIKWLRKWRWYSAWWWRGVTRWFWSIIIKMEGSIVSISERIQNNISLFIDATVTVPT